MKKKLSKNVWLTGFTSLFTDISSEMVYPLIPVYLSALGAGAQTLGIIEGLAESTASLLKVFSGTISDWLKKRKFLAILGYSFSAFGKFLLYLARTWQWVLLGRLADRFGKGIRTAPRDAIIAESVDADSRGRAFGLHRAMDTLGAFIGVALAIVISLSLFGGNGTASTSGEILSVIKKILLYSLIPALIGIIFLFFVTETGAVGKGEKSSESVSSEKSHLTIPALIKGFKELPGKLKAFLILIFIFNLGNSSNMFLLKRAADVLGELKPELSLVGPLVLYLLFNASYMLVAYPAGVVSDKIGRKWVLVLGYAIYSLVYFGFAFFASPVGLIILFAVYGLYMGLTEGVEKALVSDLSTPQLRATVLGLHATLVGIGLLPASFLAGFLYQINPAYAFSVGGIFALSAAVGMIFIL